MISVVYRLPEYLIRHRPEVVGEGRHDFLVLEELEAAEVCHVDEDVVVQLDLEVAALLYEEGEARLLLRELIYKTCSVSEGLSDLHADFSLRLLI